MHRHTLDPVSAVFGAAAIALGVLVLVGRADTLVENPVWAVAVVAISIGVMLLELAFRRWHNRRLAFASHTLSSDVAPDATFDDSVAFDAVESTPPLA